MLPWSAIVLMVGGPLKLDPKFWGVVLMGASVMIFFGLPWLDRSPGALDALPTGLAFLAV